MDFHPKTAWSLASLVASIRVLVSCVCALRSPYGVHALVAEEFPPRQWVEPSSKADTLLVSSLRDSNLAI